MAAVKGLPDLFGRWGIALPVLSATLFVAAALFGPLDAARASGTFTSDGGLTISDNWEANPYPLIVEVAGLPADEEIMDLEATIHGFSHTYPGDVDVLLVAPEGQRSILFSDTGSTREDVRTARSTPSDALAAGS